MKHRNVLSVIGLLIGVGEVLCAQVNLNRAPSREIGQPLLSITTRNPNLVEGREFYSPQAVTLDTTVSPPVLYVSDLFNNRVLGWRDASGFSNGARADFVIGQKDFYSTARLGPGTAFSTGLSLPTGLAVDASGNLYVVDTGNNRILRFPKPYAQSEQFPNLVIGQTALSCAACNQPNSGGISAKTISVSGPAGLFVAGLAFDPRGNLWFTDGANNRVLRYPATALGPDAPNGPAADLVLGQLVFDVNTQAPVNSNAATLRTALFNPSSLTFDPSGRLYVADGITRSFSRVLVFQPNLSPQTFDNGRAALRIMGLVVLQPGQPLPPPINEVQFANAQGVFMVGNNPGVVDTGNNRLLLFDPFEQWPSDGSSPHAKSSTGPVGQFGYTAGKINRDLPEPRANTFNQPSFAVATANELFVADTGNHRVVVYPVNGLGQNATASRVLGQDDFTFRGPNLLEGREVNFSPPDVFNAADGGVIVDLVSDVPHLYIADSYNHRVLGYYDARRVRPGDKADLVIGQPDFQRSIINYPANDPARPSAQSLFLPIGLAVDADRNLFVADAGNGRVLRFPRPFEQEQPNFPRADLVLGQSSFTAQVTDPSERTMHSPYGLAFTSDGGLLVSDSFHNRVLLFGGRSQSFVNGMPASKVFGQSDFVSLQSGADTNQMNAPKHIATDSDDRLYVADESNARLLIFDNVLYAGSNARAGVILTGPNQTTSFGFVRGIFVSKTTGEIWTTETNQSRILRFPKFDDLAFLQNTANFSITSNAGVAIAQDSFGDLFVAEFSNRIAVYYPGLSALNAANNIQGRALAPGAIVMATRQGSPFTDASAAADPANWPTELNDVQVLVNDSPAAIKSVNPDQLNFQMPMSASDNATIELQVVRKSTGQILGATQVNMAPVSPALFTRNGFGTGQLVATNEDGTPNEPSNPVGRGKVISLFGTGQGYIPGAPPDGQAPSDRVPTPQLPRVFIGTRFVDDANIVYSGLAPGQVGVWQIDVKIPDFVAPSSLVQVVVQLRSISSSVPPQVQTIAVSQQ